MPRQQPPAVLHVEIPLERGLEEVAERARDGHDRAEHDRLRDREEARVIQGDEDGEDPGRGACDEALPRLRGRDRGGELVAPDGAPDQVRSGVVDPYRDDDCERREPYATRP